MAAISNRRSANTNTLLDWLDIKLSIEGDDSPMIDLKYFAAYDPDFGFKMAVDGLHNLPKQKNIFYVVIMSINPPASLYTESKIPTNDVQIIIMLLLVYRLILSLLMTGTRLLSL